MTEITSSSCRVLVVDDCRDTTTSLSLLLGCWGLETRSALSGADALTVAADYHPDVVLLDLAMPGMDGFELARRLRRQLRSEAAILVSMSGYGQDEDRQHALEAGCDHHLVKPVDLDVLHGLLNQWCRPGRPLQSALVGEEL